ncbi:MAG: threo-3-hydroxy-L-aspartate ammonia-lyase [Gaiellales bacterium]|jgi:threonine dehydratase|nr:threo-3-hydroxy-L-aspartate ammonia-lyase [Gaiellales bacterium]
MQFEADLEAARGRIADGVVRTPVWHSDELDAALGRQVWLKCEPLQRTGSFKLRGATNAVRALPAGTRGVVAVSSGNHAQAVAYAGRAAGLPVTVVMNADANAAKVASTIGYGATVVSDGVDPTNREEIARDLGEREGLALVHPFDDWNVIAGQGTAALELFEDAESLDSVVTPIGGGGLLSGTALACRLASPATRAYGAEPAASPDARQSLAEGRRVRLGYAPSTISDGARTVQIGERSFAVLSELCAGISLVNDDAARTAMALVWDTTKLLIEPTSALAIAAISAGAVPGERIGVVLSGGNVDARVLAETIRVEETA